MSNGGMIFVWDRFRRLLCLGSLHKDKHPGLAYIYIYIIVYDFTLHKIVSQIVPRMLF